MIQAVVFKNGNILVSNNVIKVVAEDYDDPDFEMHFPYKVDLGDKLYPYLGVLTDQTVFSFKSNDIFTMFTPNEMLTKKYLTATKIEEKEPEVVEAAPEQESEEESN